MSTPLGIPLGAPRTTQARTILAQLAAVLASLSIAACASTSSTEALAPSRSGAGAAPTTRPAPILHTVFIRLRDPLDTAELSRDSLDAAARIPSVTTAFAGLHLETGRDTVIRDYDLCFTLGFDTIDGYEQYLAHPAHAALLETWRDRIEWLRIYDAQDVRP